MSANGSSPNLEPATAVLATLLLDERQTFDQRSSQRIGLKKTLISHGGIAPQIQKYFQRLETRNYRVTSVVDDKHSPPTDKRIALVPETGQGRDSGIEDGRQSSVSSMFEHHYIRTVLTHKEFSVYKHALLCAQYPVLGRNSRPNSRASNTSSAHLNPGRFLLSPQSSSSHSPYSFHVESEDDEDGSDADYPIQTETLSAVVRSAFQLTEERHLYYDKNIMEGLGWKAPAKVLVEELVSRLALLERNRHPFYQPQAFETRNAYDFWQQQDRIRISELINKFWYFGLPSPASSLCKPSYWESMHEEYTDLMHKLIRYDKSQAMGTGSLLSSASRRLLKEFGLRYGVGELYRRIVYLVYLTEKDNFESELWYMDHISKQLASLRDLLMVQQARFTMVRMEFELLNDTISKLHNHCGDWLQRLLQDTHSPNRVASLANLLCSVLELRLNLTGKKQTSVEHYMQQYLQEGLKQAYHSHKLRLTTELNLNAYTTPVSAEMINKLIINIRDEVTRCRQCYNEVFSRFNLDVAELAMVTLYDLLMVDVLAVCQLAAEQEQSSGRIDQDLLALAYRLSQLDQEWRAYILPHAQQWRQPLMAQTRLWLSHLTRDLTSMVLNSTNNDKFKMLELPIDSARMLPNPPPMGPHMSQRICQSPRSAFSSFQTKDQSSLVTSTPHMKPNRGAGGSTHKQHDVTIEAEVHTQELPARSTNPEVHSMLQTTSHDENRTAAKRERDALKEQLLRGKGTKMTRSSSAPDLEWFEKESKSDDTLHPAHSEPDGDDIEAEESKVIPFDKQSYCRTNSQTSRGVVSITSSADSGVGRFSSQEDFDQDGGIHPELAGDRSRWRRSWHGRSGTSDGKGDEPTNDLGICIEVVDTVHDEDDIITRTDSDSDTVNEMNNNEKDSLKDIADMSSEKESTIQIDSEQCADLDSDNSQNQSLPCDLLGDVSPDDISSSKEENKTVDQRDIADIGKQSLDFESSEQYSDNIQNQGIKVDNLIEIQSTNSFVSIPAAEQDNLCQDKGHLEKRRSSASQDDGDIASIQEGSFKPLPIVDQVNLPKPKITASDTSQNDTTGIICPIPIVGRTSASPGAGNENPVESCATADVASHIPCSAGVLYSIEQLNHGEKLTEVPNKSDLRVDTTHEDKLNIPSPTSKSKVTIPEDSTLTSDLPFNDDTIPESGEVESYNNSTRHHHSSLCHAASDLASHIPCTEGLPYSFEQLSETSVIPQYHPQLHSTPGMHGKPQITQKFDDGITTEQHPHVSFSPVPHPSSQSTPIQRTRLTNTQSLEDSITASLVLTDFSEEEERQNLAVSCSIVDVLVMVQQMVSFVSELCLILCPLPGTQEVDTAGPADEESYSAVLCRDRALRMRGELLNGITQTLANTLGLYVQNLLSIDVCATQREVANRLLSRQITEDLEERKRLLQLGRCRHERAGISDCNMYLYKEADLLCDSFEPITQEMCVRINNTWCLSCLVPCFQGLLPKGLLHHQTTQHLASDLMDDLTFDLTPHSDNQYIATVMETQIKLLAHKLNLFLARGLEVLMSDEMPGCCMAVRLQPITECLSNYLSVLSLWLYPQCYQLFTCNLWLLMIKNFENEVQHLVTYNEKADEQALLLLQGLTHLIEHLHNGGEGLSIDDLVEPAEPVLQLLQLFTLSTRRLIHLHKKLFKERASIPSRTGPSSSGVTAVMPRDKLRQMFNELHKKRKCFTGKHLTDWILENCINQDQVGVNPLEQASDIAERLLDMGVISPVTSKGETPFIKPGDFESSTLSRRKVESPSSQSETEFPPVTLHSVTNSGYWREDDSSDVDSKKSRSSKSHHASGRDDKNLLTASHLDRIHSPYLSEAGTNPPSRCSSTSSLYVFRADHTHFYCFTDIDDEVFYGVATRIASPTSSTLQSEDDASSARDTPAHSYRDDQHLKVMSVTPEFVLGIIYARRKKNQEALKYVEGLPINVMLELERPVSSFWFCLSVCQ